MIFIDVDDDVFYDDAVVLTRSFYPREEVKRYKAGEELSDTDILLKPYIPDYAGMDKKHAHEAFKDSYYKYLCEKQRKRFHGISYRSKTKQNSIFNVRRRR